MMPEKKIFKVAILWRGDLEARRNATPANNRFHRIFEELAAVGIHAEPAVYDEDFADEVREQRRAADAGGTAEGRTETRREGSRPQRAALVPRLREEGRASCRLDR